jgi:hypothetical protein
MEGRLPVPSNRRVADLGDGAVVRRTSSPLIPMTAGSTLNYWPVVADSHTVDIGGRSPSNAAEVGVRSCTHQNSASLPTLCAGAHLSARCHEGMAHPGTRTFGLVRPLRGAPPRRSEGGGQPVLQHRVQRRGGVRQLVDLVIVGPPASSSAARTGDPATTLSAAPPSPRRGGRRGDGSTGGHSCTSRLPPEGVRRLRTPGGPGRGRSSRRRSRCRGRGRCGHRVPASAPPPFRTAPGPAPGTAAIR